MHVQMCKLVLREEEASGLFIGNMSSLTLACCKLRACVSKATITQFPSATGRGLIMIGEREGIHAENFGRCRHWTRLAGKSI